MHWKTLPSYGERTSDRSYREDIDEQGMAMVDNSADRTCPGPFCSLRQRLGVWSRECFPDYRMHWSQPRRVFPRQVTFHTLDGRMRGNLKVSDSCFFRRL